MRRKKFNGMFHLVVNLDLYQAGIRVDVDQTTRGALFRNWERTTVKVQDRRGGLI